jgi:hypothetical protein
MAAMAALNHPHTKVMLGSKFVLHLYWANRSRNLTATLAILSDPQHCTYAVLGLDVRRSVGCAIVST